MNNICKTLNVKQLADYLGIGMNTAYQLVKMQGFPALKLGKRIIIPIDSLEDWVKKETEQKGTI